LSLFAKTSLHSLAERVQTRRNVTATLHDVWHCLQRPAFTHWLNVFRLAETSQQRCMMFVIVCKDQPSLTG